MKYTVIVLFILLIALPTYAGVDLVPKIGYNASKFSTSYKDIETGFISGLQIGIISRYGEKLFIEPELVYSIDGSKIKPIQSPEATVNQSSIDIGAYLGYNIFQNNLISVNLHAGPFVSIYTDNGLADVPSEVTNATASGVDLGLKFGAGIDLGNFLIEMRYFSGFLDIIKSENKEIAFNKLKFELGIGIFLFKM